MPAKLRAVPPTVPPTVPPAMTLAEKVAAANYHMAEGKRLQAEATAEARAILRQRREFGVPTWDRITKEFTGD